MLDFFRSTLVWAVLAAGLVPAGALALDDHLGPVADGVVLGADGDWTARDSEGWFILGNDSDPNSIKYYWVDQKTLTSGERRTTVRVLPRGGGDSHAGLLFHHVANDRYLAFTIGTDGSATLFRRAPGSFNGEPARAAPRLDGSDVLEIVETPTRAVFYLNGQQVFEMQEPQGFSGRIGIVAIGTGRFAYDEMDIQTAGTTGTPSQPKSDPVARKDPSGRRGDDGEGGDKGRRGTPRRDTGPSQQGNPEKIYQAQVLLGTTLGVFFHEFGHALIGETGLPATGPEEDVADGFSAFVLSAAVEESNISPEEQEIMAEIVRYSTLLWYYTGVQKARAGQDQPWQSEHAPDLKRFRNAFCIVYGSNPERHDELANKVGLEDRTKERCTFEYGKRYRAWETILKTVSRDLGPDAPGIHPANTPGGQIRLTFEPANSPTGRAIEQLLQTTGFMGETIAEMERLFVWPRNLDVVFRECEEVNAWYNPGPPEVVMCYSLIDYLSRVIFRAEGTEHLAPR